MKIGKLWFDKPRKQEVPDLSDPEVRVQMQKEAGMKIRELTEREKEQIRAHAHRSTQASMAISGRVGHYITGDQPISNVKCSCGKVFTRPEDSAVGFIEALMNAAIAHGIDVERGRNGI